MDLIITNGDAAGELLRRAIPRAEVLPWRDVLHEGPVPPTGTLAELTAIRAEYLADRGWGEREEIATYLQARDRGLAHSTAHGLLSSFHINGQFAHRKPYAETFLVL